MGHPQTTGGHPVTKCPFVTAVQQGRIDDAYTIARAGPEPAEDPVIEVLIRWASA